MPPAAPGFGPPGEFGPGGNAVAPPPVPVRPASSPEPPPGDAAPQERRRQAVDRIDTREDRANKRMSVLEAPEDDEMFGTDQHTVPPVIGG